MRIEAVPGIIPIFLGRVCCVLVAVLMFFILIPAPVLSEGETKSGMSRYRQRVRTGYYEGYEVSPRRQRVRLAPSGVAGVTRNPFAFSPTAAQVRIRARLPDSHSGLRFYERNTCVECHAKEARDLHSVRGGISCRQCHGPEPIPAINHYYSLMNPIRKHAYVCAKCHEGATASFATFVVHGSAATSSHDGKENYPVLYYANLAMLLLLIGTLAFFGPHTIMVGVRELVAQKWLNEFFRICFSIVRNFVMVLKDILVHVGRRVIKSVMFFRSLLGTGP